MIRPKSAQSANNAAVVIILIAVMIILYILFLPPEDRAAILGEEYGPGSGGPGGASGNMLHSSTPGRLFPTGGNAIEHTMPSFIVFTVTNPSELKKVDSLYIKNSVFSDQVGEVVFFHNPDTTDDVKLSYSVLEYDGRLKITLNGNAIFEGEVTQGSPPPLPLAREYLQTKNTLLFTASEPGAAFWRINEYQISGVLVSGSVTDYSASSAEQHFSITDDEYERMEKAILQFTPDCPPDEIGQLQLLLNGRPVYTGVPDCGASTRVEVSKDFLRKQDNVLMGSTSSGSFLVDMPKVTTQLKANADPIFYFNVPYNLLDAIYYGQRGLAITLRFADSQTIKRGTVDINGYKVFFETQDFIYMTHIDPQAILEGPNSIRIEPQANPIDVVELRVDVVS